MVRLSYVLEREVFPGICPRAPAGVEIAAVQRGEHLRDLASHGAPAQRYVREFDRKWLRGGASPDEPLIGSADIQSLADLGNSFEVVKDMKPVPFTIANAVQLAVTTLLPALPLTLTMISLEELVARLVKIAF